MRNVVRKKVTKLYHGYLVSIRDYELKKAYDMGGMIIIHNKEIMFLNRKDLKEKAEFEDKIQKSKFGKPYRLVNFRWKPNQDSRQKEMF